MHKNIPGTKWQSSKDSVICNVKLGVAQLESENNDLCSEILKLKQTTETLNTNT